MQSSSLDIGGKPSEFRVGRWLVSPDTNTISKGDHIERIEPKIMEVLIFLAARAGDVVSKEQLLNSVWADVSVSDQVVKVTISELRKVLGDDTRNPQFINTVPKRGYQLIAPVTFTDQASLSVAPQEKKTPLRARRPMVAAAIAAILLSIVIVAAMLKSNSTSKVDLSEKRINSVAVLPFENLSGNQEEEFFADGMTDAVISDLARIGAVKVISRTSSMRYKGKRKSPAEIAGELGVDALVEGTCLKEGNRVRLAVRLIDPATNSSVWAENYERDLSDILSLQSELSLNIARNIKAKVALATSSRKVDPAAYEAYLKGRYFWNKRNSEGFQKSIEYYNEAIARDSDNAMVWAGIADTYTVMAFYSSSQPQALYKKAREAAEKALALDSTLAETITSLAGIKHKYDLDWDGAERDFQRAIQLKPSYPTARHWYAIYLQSRGRFDEALEEIDRALELDPFSLIIRTDRGWILYTARRYDEAIAQLRQVLEMEPGFPATYFLALAYAKKGMYEEARVEIDRAIKLSNRSSTYISLLGYVHALADEKGEAFKILEELLERLKSESAIPYQFAIIYAALGDNDQALKWLEQIRLERSSWMPFFKVEPELDPLRSDPRFNSLLQKLGAES